MGAKLSTLRFLTLIGALLIIVPSCSVIKLKQNIKDLDADYAYIVGAIDHADAHSRQIYIALYKPGEKGNTVAQVRHPDKFNRFYMFVRTGSYTLVAFEDLNDDAIYQPGEPAARINNPYLSQLGQYPEREFDYESIPAMHFTLSRELTLDMEVDLSLRSLHRHSIEDTKSLLGLTSLSDPRFSDENIKRGLWEPLWFEQNIGYGTYWLKPYQIDKKVVLLVHGISSSPAIFADLIDELDEDVIPLVFHYPSGFPLDHTAYLLELAIGQLFDYYPDIASIDIVAHSMGGLVSRGAINFLSPQSQLKINNYITLSTPWEGHAGAALGVEWSPAIAPVWYSMAPNSQYIEALYEQGLATNINHHMVITYARELNGKGASDDGVVSTASQLSPRVQRDVTALYALQDNHNGGLRSSCAAALIRAVIADGSTRIALDASNCQRLGDSRQAGELKKD